MKPLWLIEHGVYREHAVPFQREVERQGMICIEVDYAPGKQPPHDILGAELLTEEACVVLWGTLPLMQQIQLRRSWVPGGWCNTENLACATYYSYFGAYLLNDHHTILPGVEAICLQEQLFAEFGDGDEVFVRPSSVHKLFAGRVAYKDDFRDAIAASRYDPTTRIVVSSAKEIGREWRLVIVDDEVVASTQYRDNGTMAISRGCPESVLRFADEMLHEVPWRPDKAFMMDICESNDELYLLELNSFSCSGLYACDLAAVIRAASATAQDAWKANHFG
ncbi:hypothetical protein C5Y96_05225 [Blastopirellula marina]|uniref:ATP-grasp domain-containing protein n=1 Tax=Blastopirellula marina TaxID=124 RepID=A0A2S8G4P3_9BACT|nr:MULTISPECIES: ATP-grasp domain-containing protein [Pirellulaceae]PQO39260.1 hypothetical protein C5Y96_05225 [Blastopirellula marina]RCS55568.1 DUF4343 domain-containing protein [Bremerella cremea]